MPKPALAPVFLLALLPCGSPAQSAPIEMDGRFDDWTPGLATLVDNNSPVSGIDLLSMQVTNDAHYLFLKLVVGTEIDLQDDLVPQTIRLYIDGDNNAATGNAVQSGYGAEVQIKFDTRVVTEYLGASSTVAWSTLDLVPLPTVTSTTFEVALARDSKPDGANDLFTSNTIKLLWKDTDGNDALPNSGSTFSYTFDATPVAPFQSIDPVKEAPELVRMTAWNILADGIMDPGKQPAFQRMLAVLSPDVIGFSECVTTTAAQMKSLLDAWLPNGPAGWYTAKDDYDMIIASRWPIVQTWPALSRQFPVLIDLPATYVTDLLFNAAHLNCCTADATRQQQCDAWAQFILDAKSPGGSVTLPANTPFVMAGDLNAVGYAQQIHTLLNGDIVNTGTYGNGGPLDWDGSPLTDLTCPQTDARMDYTWRSNTSAYPSGRLDYFIFSDAAAGAAKHFTLRTSILSPARLAAFGLQANDDVTASDHLPITTDLSIPLSNVRVNVRCLLEGPYDAVTGMMHDSLRTRGAVPLTEPYTALGFAQAAGGGGEATTAGVLATAGNDAVVDWVLLELRNASDSTAIVATRCALLERDGDVVATDGTSPVSFAVGQGDHYLAVRHRNHLGAMSASPLPLSYTPVPMDFTVPATDLAGSQPVKDVSGTRVLWAGNARVDDRLKYTGADSDRDAVLTRIGGVVPTATASGYFAEDVNMDGTVKYTGVGNDRDRILVNIGGTVPTNIRLQQLP